MLYEVEEFFFSWDRNFHIFFFFLVYTVEGNVFPVELKSGGSQAFAKPARGDRPAGRVHLILPITRDLTQGRGTGEAGSVSHERGTSTYAAALRLPISVGPLPILEFFPSPKKKIK